MPLAVEQGLQMSVTGVINVAQSELAQSPADLQ